MKRRTIGLLLIVSAIAVTAYRHSIAMKGTGGGPEICKRVKDKLECNSEAAMIQKALNECSKACPTPAEWKTYCSDIRFKCESDCEFLKAEGKSAADIRACKESCAKTEVECKTSYRDKGQCEQACKEAYQKSMDNFNKRWSRR